MAQTADRACDISGVAAAGQPWLAVVVLVVTVGLWSLGGPLIKLLSGVGGHVEGTSGAAIAVSRSMIGGLLLVPIAWRRRDTLRHGSRVWMAACVVAFAVMTVCFVVATARTAAANAIILQNTSAVWVFLLSAIFLHERPTWGESAALLLAMGGVVVIVVGHGSADLSSLLIALISGWGYGTLTVMMRGLRRVDSAVIVCINCLGSALLLSPMLVWSGGLPTSAATIGLLAMLSIFQFTGPYILFSWALKHIQAHRAALIVLLETVLNPIFTYLIVGEHVPKPTLVGGPLIILSVAVSILIAKRKESDEPREMSTE
ncbi:MAG TPA: DMT family transporter [Phycisphaerae bacterium]|nr:DMT family transporter [Phycisphaerae bacterium]HRY68393.1 DMT family transporter [Phycisphaerae bacterium]HSA27810.1 DMT family transporter [Phycisphaerae bacterium]